MVKRNFMAYLDAELIELAKDKGINISRELNEYLKILVQSDKSDINTEKTIENKKISLERELLELEGRLKFIKSSKERDKKVKIDKEIKEALK